MTKQPFINIFLIIKPFIDFMVGTSVDLTVKQLINFVARPSANFISDLLIYLSLKYSYLINSM